MKRSLPSCASVAFSLCLLVACGVAQAKVVTDPAEIIETVKSGEAGGWFDTLSMIRCLQADENASSYSKQIAKLNAANAKLKKALASAAENMAASGKQLELLGNHVGFLNKELARKDVKIKKWQRVAFGMVVVAGSVMAAGIAISVVALKSK